MIDERKISIVIPTYNRFEMTIEAFDKVLNDDRVSSVFIFDDFSTDNSFDKLYEYFYSTDKVKVHSNSFNADCYKAKMMSVLFSKDTDDNDFCILLDSDNIIDKSYIDAIYSIDEWNENTFYTPCFAKPNFDFRKFYGTILSKENIAQYIDNNEIQVCLNAANYFINKNKYLSVYDATINPHTSDSIYMAMLLLESNGKIIIVPNMEYEHRVHDGSHYKKNNKKTPIGFHGSILEKLKNMK